MQKFRCDKYRRKYLDRWIGRQVGRQVGQVGLIRYYSQVQRRTCRTREYSSAASTWAGGADQRPRSRNADAHDEYQDKVIRTCKQNWFILNQCGATRRFSACKCEYTFRHVACIVVVVDTTITICNLSTTQACRYYAYCECRMVYAICCDVWNDTATATFETAKVFGKGSKEHEEEEEEEEGFTKEGIILVCIVEVDAVTMRENVSLD